ncbi:M23 family metallopeptidase [Candidatus Parcubacteria bacterium]|nr:M23 family metallopeptidase [Candidatus Parcubacteria bacterium]
MLFTGLAFAGLVFVAVDFITPPIAHAGFLNVVSAFLTSDKVDSSLSESKSSSQKMQLLEAPLSFNLAVGGGGVTIIDSSALESIGSIGTDIYISPDQISLYVVRKGDTLSQIAEMFGVSTNTIVWGNDLSGSTISVGQTLVILPITGVQHTVKAGDTIESIAKKYGGDADEIKIFNDIKAGAKLLAGDVIVVPGGETASVPLKANTTSKSMLSTSYGAPKNPLAMRAVSKGYYIRPLVGGRVNEERGVHGYNGVDAATPLGTPILASAPGVVIVSKNSGWNGGYGVYTVISHSNGTQTLYAHLSSAIAPVGSQVVQGQVIGRSGSTGNSTGPHLHFEIRGAKNILL